MCISGLTLAFFKGWKLALPMLLLAPMMMCGLSVLMKAMMGKYVAQAGAFAKASAFSE